MGRDQYAAVPVFFFPVQLLEEFFGPLLYSGKIFSPGRRLVSLRPVEKSAEFLRQVPSALRAALSFEFAERHLYDPLIFYNRRLSSLKNQFCRLLCPGHRTRITQIKRYIGKPQSRLLCKPPSELVQRDIHLPLDSSRFVPIGLPVPDHIQLHIAPPKYQTSVPSVDKYIIYQNNFHRQAGKNCQNFRNSIKRIASCFNM